MRLMVLVLAALIASGPAAAQAIAPPWKQYPEPVEGFLLTFPGEPELAYPKWELVPKRPAEATVYSVRYNNSLFRMTVTTNPRACIRFMAGKFPSPVRTGRPRWRSYFSSMNAFT
jgi:hypothetical protein